MRKLNLAIIGQGRSGRDIHGLFYKSAQNTKFNVCAVVEKDDYRREKQRKNTAVRPFRITRSYLEEKT